MKRKLFAKRAAAGIVTACLVVTGSGQVFATTLENAQSEKAAAEEGLDSVNEEIDSITSQQNCLLEVSIALDEDLVTTIANISILEDEIAQKEVELDEANADLGVAEEKEAEQYDSMKERINYMYENGGGISFFNALLGANSFSDALNRVEMFASVYSTDRDLLQEYIDTEEEIESLMIEIQEEEASLMDQQSDLEAQQDSLNAMIDEKSAEMDDFDSMLASAQALAAEYKATINEQTAIIEQEVAAQQAAAAAAEAAAAEETAVSEDEEVQAVEEEVRSNDAYEETVQEYQETESASESYSSDEDYYEEPSYEETSSSSSGSSSGQAVADYACQFVGNPYVWGGSSLTNGCDCSGFIMSVYAHFGVSLPHSSYSLRSVGYAVSASDLQPGDIVCYKGHCAIYIGGGEIVHASNSAPYPQGGIKIGSDYTYSEVVALRRIF